jgi:hypothetical protein
MQRSPGPFCPTAGESPAQQSGNFVVEMPLRSISASAVGLAMDRFDKKPILPVEVMITLAINIVVAVLVYYANMLWGLFGG